ncbi:MAG: outer membrane protein assembly factor BamD [Bacteroidaceae bacterium]|nr:outer membrane protein assembly factor BamD [Bacteroidaceae bacterium]
MKKTALTYSILLALTMAMTMLSGCSGYSKALKSSDYDYRYEFAKALYIDGKYTNASSMIEDCVLRFRGSEKAEEAVFLLANCYYNMKDYISASQYFQTYYKTYPRGQFATQARFLSGKSLYFDTPDPRLDPTSTYAAISELQMFLETNPYSDYADECNEMIYDMYDRLVEKEMKSATLYYNLGNFRGNNYESCIITAQNAMKNFPYTKYREELSFLVLKAYYKMAEESVEIKKIDRFRNTIDEYYSFKNEFPESQYMKEADKMFQASEKYVNKAKS